MVTYSIRLRRRGFFKKRHTVYEIIAREDVRTMHCATSTVIHYSNVLVGVYDDFYTAASHLDVLQGNLS